MGEADGRVYIDTEIQTDGFEAGSKEIEVVARRMVKTVSKIGESAKISLQKQTDAFIKQNQMLSQQKSKVEALEEEYERLSNQQIETEEFKEIGKQIEADTVKLNRLEKTQEEFLSAGGKKKSTAYKKRQLQIEELRKSIKYAKGEQQELLSSGGAYTSADTSAIQEKLAYETQKLEQMNRSLDTSYMSLKQKVISYGGSAENLTGIKARLINIFKKFGTSAKNVGKKLLGLNKQTKKTGLSMKRMLATSLLMGFAFQAFSAAIQAVKTGMNNLAKYSEETNVDLSKLKSSLTRLKNSFATAFAPILTVVTPILTKFISLLSRALTYIGKFFAALSGKDTFTKAVEVQEDYAASLGDTATSAEEAEKAIDGYLSPLDEINKMDSQGASTSVANNAGTASVSEMFEEESIDTKIALPEIDWKPFEKSMDTLKEKVKPLTDMLLGALAWAYEKILIPLAKWTIEDALPALIILLANAFELLGIILEKIGPILIWLWDNILDPFAKAAGDVVIDIIYAFNGLVEFLNGVFTGDWERAFTGLETILNSFLSIVNTLFGLIENMILIPFDNFLQKVFAKDWTVEFGIMGEGLNVFFILVKDIWNGIKDIFYGFVKFINGVFLGNWTKAWEGLKQIVKGVFDSLVGIVKFPINAIIAIINSFITGFVAGINTIINGINSIKFSIPDWVPAVGGKSVGFNLSQVTGTKIPYLATGAVIPPNSPFMAVLGDQKQGTNIETPEKLLRQIMREELGGRQSFGGTYKFIGQINRRVLFEEMINEAKLRQSQNGRNPFELA